MDETNMMICLPITDAPVGHFWPSNQIKATRFTLSDWVYHSALPSQELYCVMSPTENSINHPYSDRMFRNENWLMYGENKLHKDNS